MLKAYLLSAIEHPEERRTANQSWKKEVLDLLSWGSEQDAGRDQKCIQAWFRAQHAETIRDRKAGASDKDWAHIAALRDVDRLLRGAEDLKVKVRLGRRPPDP